MASNSTSPTPSPSGSTSGSLSSSSPTASPTGGPPPPPGLPSPIVITQFPIFACVPASYNITGGTPPYTFVYIINSGISNAPILKTLPDEAAPGVYSWGVDIPPGTSITFVAKDSLNSTGYSAPVVIEAPVDGNMSCLHPKHHTSIAGPVVGGVLGGLVAIAAAYLAFSWWSRRQRNRLRDELVNAGEIEVKVVETGYGKQEEHVVRRPTLHTHATGRSLAGEDNMDEPLTGGGGDGGANLVRAGTFNLHGIAVRDRDAEEEALANPPPRYPRVYREGGGSSAPSIVDSEREIRGP